MARPVTLFTGQWADLTLEVIAQKASQWGYDGIELPFRPVATFVRGVNAAAEGTVSAEPGQGRFVRPPVWSPQA